MGSQRWNGDFYESTTLRDMGLQYQVGHIDLHCTNPSPIVTVTVMDTNSIHLVAVNFCECSDKISRRIQLLREEWFPATVHQPQTCATGRLLRQFHILTLTGKLPAYDYYQALERLTDNTGVDAPKVCLTSSNTLFLILTHCNQPRYKELMRIVRQYRHLKLMKRAGRGNVVKGLITTGAGDLAVTCPACPIPGVNLPDGWEDAPPLIRYVFADCDGSDTHLLSLQISLYPDARRRCQLPSKEFDQVERCQGSWIAHRPGVLCGTPGVP